MTKMRLRKHVASRSLAAVTAVLDQDRHAGNSAQSSPARKPMAAPAQPHQSCSGRGQHSPQYFPQLLPAKEGEAYPGHSSAASGIVFCHLESSSLSDGWAQAARKDSQSTQVPQASCTASQWEQKPGRVAAQAVEPLPPILPASPSRDALPPLPAREYRAHSSCGPPSFHCQDQTKVLQRPVKETGSCLPCPGNLLAWQASGDTFPCMEAQKHTAPSSSDVSAAPECRGLPAEQNPLE